MSCTNFNATCPSDEAKKLFDFVNGTKDGKPVTPDPNAAPSAEQKARDDATTAINALSEKVPVPPTTLQSKCQLYCQQIQAAEAERCRQLREKVSVALEAAGCPSDITPKAGSQFQCLPCQGMSPAPTVAPAWSPPPVVQFPSSTSNAATAGSCVDGTCSWNSNPVPLY